MTPRTRSEILAGLVQDRNEVIASLRYIANTLERYTIEEVPTPRIYAFQHYAVDLNADPMNIEPPVNAQHVHVAMHKMPGGWVKETSEDYTAYTKTFCGRMKWVFKVSRATSCRRVMIGIKTVPAVPEHEEPIYEWQCDGPLDV